MQVLLIEDDISIRDAVRDVLELEGYEVREAANGRDGLDALRAGKSLPGVVLLDMTMPVMNGNEFLNQLRADPKLKEQCVIVFTAARHAECPEKADDFIRKPFEIDSLIELVRKYA